MKNRILVFVKKEYVRDAEAFTELPAEKYEGIDIYSASDCEEGWADIEGPVLVGDFQNMTLEEVRERIRRLYPDASEEVFEFMYV